MVALERPVAFMNSVTVTALRSGVVIPSGYGTLPQTSIDGPMVLVGEAGPYPG